MSTRFARKSIAQKTIGAMWQTVPIDYSDNVIIYGEYISHISFAAFQLHI